MNIEEIRRQTARKLAETLQQDSPPELVRLLAQTLPRLEDEALLQGVLDALGQIQDPAGLDALWSAWHTTRHPGLENLLIEAGCSARQPALLKLLSALKLRQVDWLESAGPESVDLLLQAAADPDADISASACSALGSLSNPAAQDEVCRWVIEHNHPIASQAAIAAGYTPRDPHRKALFYLLTEQWERYESLDFDASLLRAVYQASEPSMRVRIASLARQSGWHGYIEAVASRRDPRRMSELTSSEWEVVLALLGRHERWEHTWQLAQAAPPIWSARLLNSLQEAGWQPQDQEGLSAFTSLAQAASACINLGAPLEKLPAEPHELRGHNRRITGLAFSPHGDLLASASADHNLRLWNSFNRDEVTLLRGHTSFVLSLAFHPDGSLLASGGADRTVRLWQPQEGRLLHTLGGHAGEVATLAFSPNGEILASGDERSIHLWESSRAKLVGLLSPGQDMSISSLAFSPDSKLLASSHADNSLHIWSLPDGERVCTLMDKVAAWRFIPTTASQGCILATTSSYGQVRIWQVPAGELWQTLPGRADGKLLAASPDGRYLAASDRQLIRLWELPSGQALGALDSHQGPLICLVFSPDGRMLASSNADKSLYVWQPEGSRFIQLFQDQTAPADNLVFSPQGGYLACSVSDRALLWPLDDLGGLLRQPPDTIPADQLTSLQEAIRRPWASPTEERWLEFTVALQRWRRRYDIELAAAPQRLALGDFDIELSA
ncbi:MAG: hypothetical protein JXB15_02740 [Anaerolineales bacterium]|nr:hypothetical protein [Anaerolineales bacterium]